MSESRQDDPPVLTRDGPVAALSRAQARLSRYAARSPAPSRPLGRHPAACSYGRPLVHLRRFLRTKRDLSTMPPDLIAVIDRFHLEGEYERLLETLSAGPSPPSGSRPPYPPAPAPARDPENEAETENEPEAETAAQPSHGDALP